MAEYDIIMQGTPYNPSYKDNDMQYICEISRYVDRGVPPDMVYDERPFQGPSTQKAHGAPDCPEIPKCQMHAEHSKKHRSQKASASHKVAERPKPHMRV